MTARASHRVRVRRQHAAARGATLFVVLLVITLLMGIGVFAARSAAIATAASGAERQMTQARYVAEYGLTIAAAKLSNSGAQSYLQAIRNATDVCYGQAATNTQRTCYKMLYSDIQSTDLSSTNLNLCDPAVASSATPGSLGGLLSVNGTTTWAQCDFSVELSDLSPGFTLPGFSLAHGKPLKFWYVNASSMGQTRIVNTGGSALDPNAAESSSTQQVRSRILLGPFASN